MLEQAMILIVAAAMAVLGIAGTLVPERVLASVGAQVLNRDGRSEARAVYGGFGLMIAVLLIYALRATEYRPGLLLCIGLALLGMAGGRVISLAADRGISPRIAAIMASEAVGGALLLLAI